MAAFEIDLIDAPRAEARRVEVVTLGSAPTIQLCRTIRLLGSNISATQATVVWVNLGSFTVPICFPATATPANFALELYNSTYPPIEITDFSIPLSELPAGMAGTLALFLVEH